jgi:nickel/cobalt transporter (NiCoT) family protein
MICPTLAGLLHPVHGIDNKGQPLFLDRGRKKRRCMSDLSLFAAATAPAMLLFGARHALDIDHITAIDNLVRMRNAAKSARWVGSLFSTGHMLAVSAEMVALIYIVKSLELDNSLQLYGALVGAVVLGAIGLTNLYSTRKFGKSGFGMLAQRLSQTTRFAGSTGSPLIIGFVFGLGFDTASQISALTVATVASATQGVQVALVLSGVFACGMIPVDTIDSFMLRATFSKIIGSKTFRPVSYALGAIALSLALLEGIGTVTGTSLIPDWSGAAIAVTVIGTGFVLGLR